MADKGIIFSAPMVLALLDGRKAQTRRLLKDAPDGNWHCDRGAVGLRWVASGGSPSMPCRAPYAGGDRLYVREHWKTAKDHDQTAPRDLQRDAPVLTLADQSVASNAFAKEWGKHRQGMHMPRWASRLWLAVTDVRVQRLQECSEADAIAEGICHSYPTAEDHDWLVGYHQEYHGEPPSQADIDQFNEGVWIAPGTDCGFGPKPRQPLWGPTALSCYSSLWNSLHTAEGTTWDANSWVVAVSFTVNHGNIDAEVANG